MCFFQRPNVGIINFLETVRPMITFKVKSFWESGGKLKKKNTSFRVKKVHPLDNGTVFNWKSVQGSGDNDFLKDIIIQLTEPRSGGAVSLREIYLDF